MPIYNVEEYLEEAILSVTKQSIGFEENIQLVLVNDGSPDNSDKICKKYEALYPDNVRYIEKKNGGVSDARNVGLDNADAEIISFLDPDDKHDLRCYEKVYNFFSEHTDTKVVGVSLYFFGAITGPHALNDKFEKGNRVVDLQETKDEFVQSNVNSAFIKKEALRGVRFDKRLKYGEDGKFINTILLHEMKIGLVGDAQYFYRKRGDGSSAVDGMLLDKRWYFDLIKFYLQEITDEAVKMFGYVPNYIQNIILHDLRWRFQQEYLKPGILSTKEALEYEEALRGILAVVDDTRIAVFNYINAQLRLYMIAFKHDVSSDSLLRNDTSSHIQKLIDEINGRQVEIDIIEDDGKGTISIESSFTGILIGGRTLKAYINGKALAMKKSLRPGDGVMSMGKEVFPRHGFRILIDKNDIEENQLEFILETPGEQSRELKQFFSYHSRLSHLLRYSYRVLGEVIAYVDSINGKTVLKFTRKSKLKLASFEVRMSARILKQRDFLSFFARSIGIVLKFVFKLINKKVWLFMDRPTSATDNGATMFEYVTSLKDNKSIYSVFVLAEESADYSRMQKIGKVVNFGSYQHKVFLYIAEFVLASHFDGYVFNPYGKRSVAMRVGAQFKLVYLQHGVLASDLSSLINKYKRNISLITVSSEQEKRAILKRNSGYYYKDENVVVAGQARFDNLEQRVVANGGKEKIVLIAPTWRQSLIGPALNIRGRTLPGRNDYATEFSKSTYLNFYNNLMNNEEFIDALEANGYRAMFCIHPQFWSQKDDFKGNQHVEIVTHIDYNDAIAKSKILVTDYSGIAFDFAYIGGAIVYTQFDSDEFYSAHTYKKGYFDFAKDGFGSVAYDFDSAIDQIVRLLKSDGVVEKKYVKRVNKFFKYTDANNAKRIFESVIQSR